MPEKLRNYVPNPNGGKDIRDSNVLGGQAQKTPAQRESNETKQHANSGSGAGSGPWGGKAKFDN
jgi:hypothetical protein